MSERLGLDVWQLIISLVGESSLAVVSKSFNTLYRRWLKEIWRDFVREVEERKNKTGSNLYLHLFLQHFLENEITLRGDGQAKTTMERILCSPSPSISQSNPFSLLSCVVRSFTSTTSTPSSCALVSLSDLLLNFTEVSTGFILGFASFLQRALQNVAIDELCLNVQEFRSLLVVPMSGFVDLHRLFRSVVPLFHSKMQLCYDDSLMRMWRAIAPSSNLPLFQTPSDVRSFLSTSSNKTLLHSIDSLCIWSPGSIATPWGPPSIPLIPALEILNFTNINTFNLSYKDISGIGILSPLEKLTTLILYHTDLSAIPVQLFSLHNLTTLEISCPSLTHIPSCVSRLTQLQDLLIIRCKQLQQLPPDLCKLSKLRRLQVYSNQLTHLPCELGQLTRLEYLDAQENALTEIPVELCALKKLNYVQLGNNKLVSLPPQVGNLRCLRSLGLSRNQLSFLPESFFSLTLTTLNTCDNPLPSEVNKKIQRHFPNAVCDS